GRGRRHGRLRLRCAQAPPPRRLLAGDPDDLLDDGVDHHHRADELGPGQVLPGRLRHPHDRAYDAEYAHPVLARRRRADHAPAASDHRHRPPRAADPRSGQPAHRLEGAAYAAPPAVRVRRLRRLVLRPLSHAAVRRDHPVPLWPSADARAGHQLMDAVCAAAGYTFSSPVRGAAKLRIEPPPTGRLGYVIAATPFPAFFGSVLIMTSSTVAQNFYPARDLPWLAIAAEQYFA